jgi:DnaK suppressor protein
MDIQFAKYKKLIEQQLEELTAENVLGQSAQKTVELDQQSVGRLSRMDALQSQALPWGSVQRREKEHQSACPLSDTPL